VSSGLEDGSCTLSRAACNALAAKLCLYGTDVYVGLDGKGKALTARDRVRGLHARRTLPRRIRHVYNKMDMCGIKRHWTAADGLLDGCRPPKSAMVTYR
jgi:hypothetical protein